MIFVGIFGLQTLHFLCLLSWHSQKESMNILVSLITISIRQERNYVILPLSSY